MRRPHADLAKFLFLVIFVSGGAVFGHHLGLMGSAAEPDVAFSHSLGIAILGLAVPLFAWLAKRAADNNDEAIKKNAASIESLTRSISELEGLVGVLVAQRTSDAEEIKLLRKHYHDLIDKLGWFAKAKETP